MKNLQVDKNLQAGYNQYYDASLHEWRRLGAKYKVQNIVKVSENQQFKRVLEIGAGDGSLLQFLNDMHFGEELFAAEISDSALREIEKRKLKLLKKAVKYDGYSLPFPDKAFDVVILSHVLEHVEFPRAILREMKRVARFQIIEVPRDYRFGMDKNMQKYLSYGHINAYTPTLLRFLLKTEGFTLVNESITFTAKEIYQFLNRKKTPHFLHQIKLSIWLIIRNLAYFFLPKSRKEGMINAYTVLCTSDASKKNKFEIVNEL